jgi:hypothetical protein
MRLGIESLNRNVVSSGEGKGNWKSLMDCLRRSTRRLDACGRVNRILQLLRDVCMRMQSAAKIGRLL